MWKADERFEKALKGEPKVEAAEKKTARERDPKKMRDTWRKLEKAYGKIKEFAFQAVLAQKNEHRIRNIFQKYVPKDVIDSLFMNPEKMLVGDNRILAIKEI